MAVQHLFVFWTPLGLRGISQRVKSSGLGGMINNELADLVSAAFAKSWGFVSTDPELGYDDTDAMRIRLSRHLESLAKYGERDLMRLANGAIVKLRRERQADRRV
jgi:hypothetical protein